MIALGQARELIPPILQRSSGAGLEIVLEEWATQKDERPPLPAGVSLPSVLTDLGDPHLGPEPIDAVFFLDTYHLLFHSKTLLAKLHERLTPDGCVYVLDRAAKEPLSRRDASHRRQIDPADRETGTDRRRFRPAVRRTTSGGRPLPARVWQGQNPLAPFEK